MGTATKKNYISRMKTAFYTYTLTPGGTCAVTTGMKPIQFVTVTPITGANSSAGIRHAITSSNFALGTFKICGTSGEIGVCKVEGL